MNHQGSIFSVSEMVFGNGIPVLHAGFAALASALECTFHLLEETGPLREDV